jgi:hypothetical protein
MITTPKFQALIDQDIWNQIVVHIENRNVVKAHTLAHVIGDAGVKIAAAIDMLKAASPGNPTGLVDATGFAHPQNMTGFTIPPGITVQLGPIWYTLPTAAPSIVVNQGAHLYGMGANSPGATNLKAFNGFNKDIIVCKPTSGAWWHHGEVRNLRLDGNKTNNTVGHGISIPVGIGETSCIARLSVNFCAQAGLYVAGSQSGTGTVQNVTTNNNGIAGVWLDDFKSGITMWGVGGDQNPTTLKITNPNNGGGSIYIMDFKSEKNIAGPAVEISGGNSPITLTLAGGNCLQSGAADTTLIRVLNSGGLQKSPIITLMGVVTGLDYSTIIDDQLAGVRVMSTPVTYHGLLTYNHPTYTAVVDA